MLKAKSVLAALLAAGVLDVGLAYAGDPWIEGGVLEFALPDLDGEIVMHNDERFRGKVVFVSLWGTWCPPCITEIPTFNDLKRRLGESGLVIVAIAFERAGSGQERREKLRQFAKKHSIEYLVLDGGLTQDAGNALPALRSVKGLPVEIFVGSDGRVQEARNGYGYTLSWARKLESKLLGMLKETVED